MIEDKYERPLGLKTVDDTKVERYKVLMYEDINGYNRLFGGKLMMMIDEAAGIVATRHCGTTVTTAAVDNLQFKQAAYLGDIVVIVAYMTYVGRTSMEVRVDTYVEDRTTGLRHVINRAYLTEVCVDDKGNPIPIPYGLDISSAGEIAEWEGALKRIEMRKSRRREGF
ncbi:acyl-CoA thioesterase [Butyrivibrio sp. MC2013]|uniref:acyl-CoA thioesterase n=1 Tax=Butyrivibrio sp. MC2013 TaxID=1280686 RepID=UPI0004135DC4|nr:acyl-CoA thioesterase [Butyrivibrio sp. MC2013]